MLGPFVFLKVTARFAKQLEHLRNIKFIRKFGPPKTMLPWIPRRREIRMLNTLQKPKC